MRSVRQWLGRPGFNPRSCHTKDSKKGTPLPNTQNYKIRIKGKMEQSRNGVAPSPTPQCSSYWKGSLQVTFDYGHQLHFFLFNNLFSIFSSAIFKAIYGIHLTTLRKKSLPLLCRRLLRNLRSECTSPLTYILKWLVSSWQDLLQV